MIPINYHHLYYFYIIAREGSISRACKILLLAQSTLSAQLMQLEASLGGKLFERKKQRLLLTEKGRMVLGYAESIFEMGRELQDAIKDRPQPGRSAIQVGILNGTPRAFGHALIECLLKDADLPRVTVQEGSLGELVAGLSQQKLDVVLSDVSMRGPDQGAIFNHLIAKIPVVLAASPKVAGRCRKIPADLDGAPFILPSLPSQVYHQVQEALAQWNIRPNVVAEVQDVELARRLAMAGRGIAPINEYTVASSLPAGRLKVIAASRAFGIHESVYLITRKRRWPNPMADRLVKNFRALFAAKSGRASPLL
ncbi:MAG: LysR family transcriptional regulator [Elusimicrobiales bacterium]|nr:LysR family transcriptional regulator [Elusimicrobiales bacterium]